MIEIRLPALPMIAKKTMGTQLPPAPDGAQLHFMIMVTGAGVTSQQMVAMVLPKGAEYPMAVTVECVQQNFPPPPPPVTDQQRRRRLIAQVLNRARDAGRLGLTTDNQENTVQALMEALDGEFADGDVSDVNSNEYDPRDDDWSTDSQKED